MTVMEFSIFPIGKGVSLSKYVAEVINIVKQSGLDYILGPMGTSVEGDFDNLLKLLQKCHAYIYNNSDRVYMTVTFDTRKNVRNRLEGKIESVKKVLSDNKES